MGIEDWGLGLSEASASILHCIINLSGFTAEIVNLVYPKTGNPYATCPTPAARANDTKIATTAWVRDLVNSALTANNLTTI